MEIHVTCGKPPIKPGAFSEHRQSRCSAIESLQAVFRWETSISCKMAFPSETLILRPEIDSGSGFQPLLGDVHAAACGLKGAVSKLIYPNEDGMKFRQFGWNLVPFFIGFVH